LRAYTSPYPWSCSVRWCLVEEIACGDQRRCTGSGSVRALEACSRRCAAKILYFTRTVFLLLIKKYSVFNELHIATVFLAFEFVNKTERRRFNQYRLRSVASSDTDKLYQFHPLKTSLYLATSMQTTRLACLRVGADRNDDVVADASSVEMP